MRGGRDVAEPKPDIEPMADGDRSRASHAISPQETLHLLPSSVTIKSHYNVGDLPADSYSFDHAFLAATATRIVNEVRGINRVVYDVTSKAPGTIEWE